jgi:Bacterial membrane protein YfhO
MNLTWLYVLALYAIAVRLARRAGLELPWRIAALFFALTLLFLLQPMTTRSVNFPTDVAQLIPPWKTAGVTPLTISNFEMQDVVMQMVPWAHEVRTAWREGRVPLWTELAGCGYPLLANMQSAALSPLRLLALPLPLGYAMTAEAAMKILIALTFTYLFCRRRGYGQIPSAIGAACFGFGPFLAVWLHFPHSTVAAFLPAVLYQIDLLAERITFGRFAFATMLGPLVLFGGHPETAAHMLFFGALYAAWVTRSKRFVATLFAAGAVSVLLALPLLAPFAEALTKSMRYQQVRVSPPHGIPYSDFPSLVLLAQPRFYGTRPAAVPWGPAQTESVSGFAGILGIGAFFGLLFRRKRDSRETFFLLAFVLLFLLLADFPPVSVPFRAVFAMAANARLRLPFAWLAAVMTAAVLHHGRREIWISIAGAAATLIFIVARTNFPNEYTLPLAMAGMIPSLVVLGVALLGNRLLIGIAIVAEIWLVTRHWNPVRPLDSMYPRTGLVAAMEKVRTSDARIAGIGEALFPNTNMLFGLADVRTHDPMANGRYVGLVQAVTKGFDPTRYYAKWNDADTPLLDYLNARWIATAPGHELDRGRYRLEYDGPDGRLYENTTVLPRFFAARNVILDSSDGFTTRLARHTDWKDTALVRILRVDSDRERTDLLAPRPADAQEAATGFRAAAHTDYRITYVAPRHTLIASSIPWWPGWRITRNGERVRAVQVNGAFLGFVVPPGAGEVRVRYVPVTFWASAVVSLVTLLALFAFPWSRRRVSLLAHGSR